MSCYCDDDRTPEPTARDLALEEWRNKARVVPSFRVVSHKVVDGKVTLTDGREVRSVSAFVEEAVLENEPDLGPRPTLDFLVERGYVPALIGKGIATSDELKSGIGFSGWPA